MQGIVRFIFFLMVSLSTCLQFERIVEQNLIIKVINNQQQEINILTYLKNSLFSDIVVIEIIFENYMHAWVTVQKTP